MIVSYNKVTGEIYGTIEGKIHDENEIKNLPHPIDLPESELGAYVVSYKRKTKKIRQVITEQVVEPFTHKIKEVKTGEREVEVGDGIEMDDKNKAFFSQIETGKLNLYAHKFKIKDGEVIGIDAKPEEPTRKFVKPDPLEAAKADGTLAKIQQQIDDLKIQIRELKTSKK